LAADDSYADGLTDTLNAALAFASYDSVNLVEHAVVEEAGRGSVLEITKQNGAGNLYFRSPVTDMTDWKKNGTLIFDIKVEQGSDTELLIKMDSGWPNTSDSVVPTPAEGEWGQVKIAIADILDSDNSFAPFFYLS
jgi:hypothetical protein